MASGAAPLLPVNSWGLSDGGQFGIHFKGYGAASNTDKVRQVGCVVCRVGHSPRRVAVGAAFDSAHRPWLVVECEYDLSQLHSPAILPHARVEYALLVLSQHAARPPADALGRAASSASRRYCQADTMGAFDGD